MLSKNQFCNIILDLYLVQEQADRINYVLRDPLYDRIENDFSSGFAFSNSRIEQDLIDTLENMFNDNSHWISYFIFELHFGEYWEPGKITAADGSDIKLQSTSDLWNILMENLNETI